MLGIKAPTSFRLVQLQFCECSCEVNRTHSVDEIFFCFVRNSVLGSRVRQTKLSRSVYEDSKLLGLDSPENW